MNTSDDNYYSENYIENAPDHYVIDATERIKKFLKHHKQSVFTTIQLQIIFENHYYHNITYKALVKLVNEGIIKKSTYKFSDTEAEIHWHRSNRYPHRKAKNLIKLIKEYSSNEVNRSCGQEANNLFYIALTERKFNFIGKDANKFNDIVWQETKHDLDFILEKDNVTYGIEIKNTFGVIEKEELNIKIALCKHLKIRPLFIMRYAPANYMKLINDAGGFCLRYGFKLYPIALKSLAGRINKELYEPYVNSAFVIKDGKIRNIIDAPQSIQAGTIDRFINNFHNKILMKS